MTPNNPAPLRNQNDALPQLALPIELTHARSDEQRTVSSTGATTPLANGSNTPLEPVEQTIHRQFELAANRTKSANRASEVKPAPASVNNPSSPKTHQQRPNPNSTFRRVYRAVERLASCLVAIALAPSLLLWSIRPRPEETPRWVSRTVLGRRGRACVLREPNTSLGGWQWLRCITWLQSACSYVARGQMAWVGPGPLDVNQWAPGDESLLLRLSVPPGWITPFMLRKWGNCAFEQESAVSLSYIATRSVMGDIGTLCRAIPARSLRAAPTESLPSIRILGVNINNVDMRDAVDDILALAHGQSSHQVCFVNADCLNIAWEDPQYAAVLEKASRVYADGSGIRWAGNWLGTPVRENVNGTDMFPKLCERIAISGERLFLVGAKPGAAQKAADWARQQFPSINIVGVHHGYFTASEERRVVEQIAACEPHILLAAFGSPKQDFWLAMKKHELRAKVAIGVGGLFDFYSGAAPRAPMWMRELGLEWCFRMLREPGRLWRRYLVGNPKFMLRVLWFGRGCKE